ncbi:hypothetical protein HK101_004444, partial [Irineochytrium annulatum]
HRDNYIHYGHGIGLSICQGGRALAGTAISTAVIPQNAMTNEACATACHNAGYALSGTEYGIECYCGNDIRNGGAAAPAGTCSFACPGNAAEKCGSGGHLSVYGNTTTPLVWPVPATKKTNLPGDFQWVGCYQDNVDSGAGPVRTLPWQFISPNMTVELCLNHCYNFGYSFAGVEYGNECYCGDSINGPIAVKGEAECTVPCAANPGELCGAGGRIGVYQWSTGQVTTFNKPANTGYYQYLMGGVIVPLITGLTTNNKIVMMEKLAGGAPNTTHAYEFDYMDGNYSTCFREMHIQTDFFCSAAVMLPDSAGRILNVGGWADVSLFGIRLYNPSAPSPKNDWQENPTNLKLQVPRWYPTAIVLRNGSVAVIGGETNSNGENQPNVEMLPATGTAPVALPLLTETHPFNLYPHAVVLPSGNLLLISDNRAQVIDPTTFSTITELPRLPGAPFSTTGDLNGSGGRTYPKSGTAVVIPPSPPYNTPMEVLVCGGSLGPGGSAIENCVRGAPEAPDNTWQIERMPFKRVMPNMVALPDGTFLILNGCQVGVAGFGLGSIPTFTAVLYDPAAPFRARMSVLNTTIVARMYHSEAILLHDGRVLVSGSDPQEEEQGYPEEYRIEVYVPPYLSSGLPRPTFMLPAGLGSVGFGASFTISASFPSGGNRRASLVAPGVNTHGNSMGMLSAFVSITPAGGGQYTIVTPPESILPTGHYLLFVLDGPTPSIGQWIRLGGDNGNLGAWPPASLG